MGTGSRPAECRSAGAGGGGGPQRGRTVAGEGCGGPCDGGEADAVWSLEAGQHNVVMPAKGEGEALLQGLREQRDVSGDSFIAAA